jgi:hypothetical protein
MKAEQAGQNKRASIRYEVELGSFAVFRSDPMVLPGLIVDISEGGLAFFYHEEDGWPQDSAELFTLFGERCNVEKVSLITTYDSEVTDKSHPIYKVLADQKDEPVKIRRRGVRFGTLSKEQEAGIETLIREYHSTRS